LLSRHDFPRDVVGDGHVDQVVRLNAPLSIFDDKLSCLLLVINIKQRGKPETLPIRL
jgi:hypothetical protein